MLLTDTNAHLQIQIGTIWFSLKVPVVFKDGLVMKN